MALEYKVAKTKEDLDKVFDVRYEVFSKEYQYIDPGHFVADRESDSFDTLESTTNFLAIDEGVGVGVVRLLEPNHSVAAKHGWDFGVDMEKLFDFSYLKNNLIPMAELPRSCVVKAYRKKDVMINLWRMAVQYAAKKGIFHLCGCAGTETDSPEDVKLLYRLLKHNNLMHDSIVINPRQMYDNPNNPRFPIYGMRKDVILDNLVLDDYKVTKSLKLFASVGARYVGAPVFYPSFRMYTVPLVWPTKEMPEKVEKLFWKYITDDEWEMNQISPI